jgi:aspartyl-tRNA(Asn)/glutamyl-tRNA(Gln) amidotransferase subunit A
LIGKPFDEETLFAAARVIEKSTGTDFSPTRWW